MQPNTAFTSNSTIETNTNNINSVTSFDKTQSTEASNPKSWFNYQLDGPTTGFAAVAAANLTADRVAPLSNSLNPWGCVGLLVGADSSSDYTPNLSQGLREPSATKGVIESGSDHNEWDLKDRSPEDDITNRNDYTGMQNSNWNDVMLQNQYVSSGLEIGHDLKFGKSMLSNKVDDLEIGQGMPMDWNDATCNSSSGWTYPPHGGTYNQGPNTVLDQDAYHGTINGWKAASSTFQHMLPGVDHPAMIAAAHGLQVVSTSGIMEKPALSHPDLAAEGQCCDDLWPQFMPQGQPLDLPDTTTNGQVSTNFLDLATQQNPAQVVGFIQSDKSSVAINSSRDLITLNLESRPVFQKARQKQFEFNNITPDYYALTKDAKGPKLRGKAGRRTGSLPLKTAIQAKNIRVLGACLRCRIAKCSEDIVCSPCKKPNINQICIRGRLPDYVDLFFPKLLVSHLHPTETSAFASKVSQGFLNNDWDVGLSFGLGIPSLELVVTEFKPMSTEGSLVPIITLQSPDQIATLEDQLPQSLALRDGIDLIRKCRAYISLLVEYQTDIGESITKSGNESSKPIADMVIGAIIGYQRTLPRAGSQKELIDKAMMIHIGHLFKDTTITLTEASCINSRTCPPTSLPKNSETNVVSKLLNRQLKCAMNEVIQRYTGEVLRDLEKLLTTRSEKNWATCFCVISILCICMENVQNAIDGFVMYLRTGGSDGAVPSSTDGITLCQILDDCAFAHLIIQFHFLYKSEQPPTSKSGIFNPIQNGAKVDPSIGIDHGEVNLVHDMRHIISRYDKDLMNRAKMLTTTGTDTIIEHMAFRQQNSDRLLSKFLKSFGRVRSSC